MNGLVCGGRGRFIEQVELPWVGGWTGRWWHRVLAQDVGDILDAEALKFDQVDVVDGSWLAQACKVLVADNLDQVELDKALDVAVGTGKFVAANIGLFSDFAQTEGRATVACVEDNEPVDGHPGGNESLMGVAADADDERKARAPQLGVAGTWVEMEGIFWILQSMGSWGNVGC